MMTVGPWSGRYTTPTAVRRHEEAIVRAVQAALDRPSPGPMQVIAEEVAAKHGLSSWKEFSSRRRGRSLVAARYECWWRCRHETPHNLPAIGRFFGFDHTTILRGIAEYEKRR